MSPPPTGFEGNMLATPIRNLGLSVKGTRLEPILEAFEREIRRVGLVKVRPRFYLSTEWGVPFDTVAIAIPFYLARPELTDLHALHVGHVEGFNRADILRYLRHELGHVVNYAYRLYEQEAWVKHFGAITQPYVEGYRPKPFSRRFVNHLPGFYAQKHPDEDWAETFAVWMTPRRDWRAEYNNCPEALAKLEYCDRTVKALKAQEPIVTADELDEDVGELGFSLEQFYQAQALSGTDFPPVLDGSLRAIFEDLDDAEEAEKAARRRPASHLIRRHERELMANVYRWTGHFPEHTRRLLRHLADRADALKQEYDEGREEAAALAFTTFVTALAMNHVYRGSYF